MLAPAHHLASHRSPETAPLESLSTLDRYRHLHNSPKHSPLIPKHLFTLLGLIGLIGAAFAFSQESEERGENWLGVSWGELAPGPEVEIFFEYRRHSLPVVERSEGTGLVDLNGLDKVPGFGYRALGLDTNRMMLRDKAGFWSAPVTWSGRDKNEHPFDLEFVWTHCGVVQLEGVVDSVFTYQGPEKTLVRTLPTPP